MKEHRLNNEDALEFIFAGNSTSTFRNSETENRFTFKVKQKKGSNIFFVSVLTSPGNYTYIGTVISKNFLHSRKSTISKDSQCVRVFEYVLNKLKLKKLPSVLEIWHEGKCGKCNRKLTVPSSLTTGLGPDCFKKLNKEAKRNKNLELILE